MLGTLARICMTRRARSHHRQGQSAPTLHSECTQSVHEVSPKCPEALPKVRPKVHPKCMKVPNMHQQKNPKCAQTPPKVVGVSSSAVTFARLQAAWGDRSGLTCTISGVG